MRRSSGQSAAVPLMAASTCSHNFCSRQMRPISTTGSMAFEEVVPTVAQTKQGTRPARRSVSTCRARASGRIAKLSSTSISRKLARPNPAI